MDFQDCTIISWNVRRVVSRGGQRYVKEMVHKYSPKVFVVMETHCLFMKAERFWKNLSFQPIAIIEARGHSGGIWVLVDISSGISFLVVDCFDQMITVRLSYEGSVWVCNAVYVSLIPSVKDRLWEHLGMDSQHISNPWMVFGYFNEILHSSEVCGGLFNH